MPDPESPKKVLYLLGAGATSAELSNVEDIEDRDNTGLSIGDVTRRVIIEAKKDPDFLKNNRLFLDRAAESSNIELLISLIESNQYDIEDAATAVDRLKDLVKRDIKTVLTEERTAKFILHKALFELHQKNEKEDLIGFISLNYDTILDDAYKSFYGDPDYSFSFPEKAAATSLPLLLKLHGSFNWEKVLINGREREIPIIPLGANKNYLRLPYNFIWGRALEALTKCNTLRIIGCSLSSNDIHLVDLLFKAHVEKRAPFDIEIISSEITGSDIKKKYGFFPKIIPSNEIEGGLIPNATKGANHFKEWLRAKGRRVLKDDAEIAKTIYLSKIIL